MCDNQARRNLGRIAGIGVALRDGASLELPHANELAHWGNNDDTQDALHPGGTFPYASNPPFFSLEKSPLEKQV